MGLAQPNVSDAMTDAAIDGTTTDAGNGKWTKLFTTKPLCDGPDG